VAKLGDNIEFHGLRRIDNSDDDGIVFHGIKKIGNNQDDGIMLLGPIRKICK